jgi:molybdopterin molybdotransferase
MEAPVREGEAARITTGARIPEGADCVVRLEDTREEGNSLRVFSSARKYLNVSQKGEDIKRGYIILAKGERIAPPHIVALKECGIIKVKVCSLSVGIVSTGDELVSGNVKNTTQPFLASFFRHKGFHAREYGEVRDDETEIANTLDRVKEDVIIVTGGTGPGEKDLLPYVIQKNGRYVFRGLRIRPGRTTAFGLYKNKPVFMLSGLPVAALIAAENVVMRLVTEWYGLRTPDKVYSEGTMSKSVVNSLGFRSYVRVKIAADKTGTRIIPTKVTGSGVIYSVLAADAILTLDENSEGVGEGDRVKVELLRWW